MRLLILLLFVLACPWLCAQADVDSNKLSFPTSQLIQKIVRINQVMSAAFYSSGIKPDQYTLFEQLSERATEEELIALTNHPNGVVRCYTFWALASCSQRNLFPFVIEHLQDTAQVRTQFGCIGGDMRVGDFFIDVVTPDRMDIDLQKLTVEQLSTLDSILLYLPYDLDARYWAIRNAAPTDQHYARIRYLATVEHYPTALIPLAKYRRPDDIPVILDAWKKGSPKNNFYCYQAVQAFPDPVFLPLLAADLRQTMDKDHYSNEWSGLYTAISHYQDDAALALLEMPFTKVVHPDIRTYHLDFVLAAVRTYPCPLYEGLYWRLWKEERRLSNDIFDILLKNDSVKTFEMTKAMLYQLSDFRIADSPGDFMEPSAADVFSKHLLDWVCRKDIVTGIDIIRANIANADVHRFPLFAEKAKKLKKNSFVEPLFQRIRKEDNPHIYLQATATLLAYQSKEIDERIKKLPHENRALRKGWGGEAFAKLVRGAMMK